MRSKTIFAVLCGGLALSATAGAAQAQSQSPVQASPQVQTALPASLERATLISWLRTNTDMDPGAVISVSPANIIGLMAVNRTESTTRRLFRVQIRSEVISAQTIREAGNNSWAADVEIDCDSRKGKVNRIIDFPMRNLRGQPREAGGSAEWVVPPPGTHLNTVVAAVCDGNFQRPLGVSPRIAAVQPSPPPPIATAPRAVVQTPPSAARAAPAQTAPAQTASAGPRQAQPDLRPRIDEQNQPYTTAAPPRPPVQAPSVRPAAPAPPAPASIAATAVQIGASSSEALANQAVRSVRAAFPDRTRGLAVKTVPVQSDGRTVYRVLFHGFHTASEARGFCSALKASGRDCFLRDGVGEGARMISSQ